MADCLPERYDFPKGESDILEYWDRIDAFHTQLRLTEGKPLFSFYDGPPFATGLPHYGHILAGTIKDIVTRYASMNGHYVERRFGWDCHGLPIEFEIDKLLGIKTRNDILDFGIKNYNEECLKIVMRYSKEWESVIKRLGRWIDFENDYKTMDRNYMESVWWVFSELWKKDLIYKGFKVMPYSTGCKTPLSNFEATQAYKDVVDPAVTVKMTSFDDPDISFLIWTTTPWTLPSNLSICVNPKFTYVLIGEKSSGSKYFILKDRLSSFFKNPDDYNIISEHLGSTLEGKKYIPLFDFFCEKFEKGFRVVCDEYVTENVGTGIVHQAPAFGEEDYRICVREGICNVSDLPCPINDDGVFTSEVGEPLEGLYIKDADKVVIEILKKRKLLFRRETLNHSYPFCWRSDTPLIYKAVSSWFLNVSSIKEKLIANNSITYWVPQFVKEKRFHNWLSDAHDWTISRNRYWGTPLPVWVSDDFEEIVVVSSISELEILSGRKFNDIHRHFIDDICIPSKRGKGHLRRTSEVFDCWFESGSMPYAQLHYPFENKEKFLSSFPADFVAEGIDQTRGWFYTLLVISTALFDGPPFRNLIANGLVLASDGKKMSKRLKNYPDPSNVILKYGADALRLYLINSPVVRAESLKFKEEGVENIISQVFVRWYNSFRFLMQNIQRFNIENGCDFKYDPSVIKNTQNVTDKWILASTQSLIAFVHQEMGAYRLYTVIPKLIKFIESLANVYVRFNRNRLKGRMGKEDEINSLSVLLDVIFSLCVLMAPFTPFFVESIYRCMRLILKDQVSNIINEKYIDNNNLNNCDSFEKSIHFLKYPIADNSLFNFEIETKIEHLLEVIELARLARDQIVCPIRQPLKRLIVFHADKKYLEDILFLKDYILSELSFGSVEVVNDMSSSNGIRTKIILQNSVGSRLRGDRKKVQEKLLNLDDESIKDFIQKGKIEIMGYEIDLQNDTNIIREFDNNFNINDTKSKSSQLSKSSPPLFHSCFNNNVIIVLDLTKDNEGRILREILNRIQRLRKHAQLVHTDQVIGFYSWSIAQNPDKKNSDYEHYNIDNIINSNRKLILENTNTLVINNFSQKKCHCILDSSCSTLIEDVVFTIQLVRPALQVNPNLLVLNNVCECIDEAENLDALLSLYPPSYLDGKKEVQVNLDQKNYKLSVGLNVFKNQYEYAESIEFKCA